jgi:microcystin-dependent protein
MTTHYYVYPFGENADDLTAIPDTAAVDGSVSYYAGWTPPYELDLLTDPTALPIPRGQMNQLFFDITNNLQQYQQYGSPEWVVGNTVSYPIYSRVYYLGQVYENQEAANTATPGADDSWLQISGDVQGLPAGSMIPWAGPVAPAGYLLCDGSAVSRSTYSGLFNNITQIQNGTTTNSLTTLTGLSSTSQMYIGMKIEGTGIQSGTTIASIDSGTAITMSLAATASATVAVTFYSWGNGDGSTTFNLPNMNRRTAVGSGGSASTDPLGIGNVVGKTGGQEQHTMTLSELVSHNHPGSTTISPSGRRGCTSGSGVQATSDNTGTLALTIASQGSTTPFNVIQPSVIVMYIIKT